MVATLPLPKATPYDVINVAELEASVWAGIEALGAATPFAVATAAPLAIGLSGVALTNYLLNNKQWDHFWLSAGAKLNNVWHAAGDFLFGHGGAADLHTVSQLIQLSAHISLRSTRQLVGSLAAKSGAAANALSHGLVSVARTLNSNVLSLTHRVQAVLAWSAARAVQVEHYSDARLHNATVALAALSAQEVNALRTQLLRDVINPLRSEVAQIGAIVRPIAVDVDAIGDYLHDTVKPNLAKALATGALAYTLAHAATTFVQECGEGMCQTVGPRTDWGKLFKRFEAGALLTLLTALAASDADEVERAAVEFGKLFGPLLSNWAEGWLGVGGIDAGDALHKVAKGVGSIGRDLIP